MENNRNRSQSYEQDWYENDQGYDRYRDNPNRYQRYGNENRGGENYGNRGWQNTGSGYSDMNRQYENRGNFYEDDYSENYRGNWNQRNYGPNYRNRNFGERNWWDKTQDEVASWFGDDEAERRRRMDKMNGPHRGKGPKGYTRTSERITEDVNEKLYQDPFVDASNIEVTVSDGEVILSGTVDSREAKRRAEDIAESVSGVKDVTNQLKVNTTISSQYETSESKTGDQHNGRKKSSLLS